MRETLRDNLRLTHILEACDRIYSYYPDGLIPLLDEKSIEFFGLVKNLEIIGEAAYMLTNEFKNSKPDTDWQPIIAMRHLLLHGYYHISARIVKEIIENDIPELKRQIQSYLSGE
ncbi:MAG: DUF86 domain-containing protein [Muribaculaceae bacterium]|nr:DUF86 domain-containing protein [Muribaculaceae bacterium]